MFFFAVELRVKKFGNHWFWVFPNQKAMISKFSIELDNNLTEEK